MNSSPSTNSGERNASHPIVDAYPLSPMQQGMLFHSVSAPGSDVYVEQLSCSLRGDLRLAEFRATWDEVLRRHATLRTAFAWHGLPEPLQVVGPLLPPPLEVLDWRALPAEELRERLAQLCSAERLKGFELTRAPLMRLKLVRLSGEWHRLIWTWHHIILDAWAVRLILEEFFAIYDANREGRAVETELPRPYKDFIAWQRAQDLSEAEAFWRQSLAGFREPTPLGIEGLGVNGHAAAAVEDGASADTGYALEFLEVPSGEVAALREAARRSRVTLNTLVQGAWALLLGRYSGREEVLFGTAVAGRPPEMAGVETMVGLFINTLPVRVNVSPQQKLGPWLGELQRLQAEARRYEHTPLYQVQGWSPVPRGTQLFESLLVVENFPLLMHRLRGGGLELSDVEFVERANIPLTVTMIVREESKLGAGYERARFDRAVVLDMLQHLRTLLVGMAGDGEQRLADLELLCTRERQQLINEWGRGPGVAADGKPGSALPVHRVFEALAERSPEALAAAFAAPDGEETLITYGELNARANRLARGLRAAGVRVEDRVAICMDASPARLVAIFAILKAGGAYVPLEPASPKALLYDMVADCGARLLLTQTALLSRFSDCETARVLALDEGCELPGGEDDSENLAGGADPSNLAYVIYTSGSTGRPKGVSISHQSLQHLTEAQARTVQIGPRSRVLQFSSLSFDASVFEMFNALLTGGQICMAPRQQLVPSRELMILLERWGVTTVVLPPSILSCLPDAELPALRTVVAAGEPCPAELVARWGRGRRFVNAYGPTEITVCATAGEVTTHDRKPSIGRPIGEARVYILDAALRPVPVGVAGDLHVGGPGVARGYWARPALTAANFLPDPFAEAHGSRMYRTGDVARFLPNGQIEFLGRLDDQVKLRGFRIELAEVEMALKQDPSVREAAVLLSGDSAEEKHLVAFVVAEPAPEPSSAFDEFALKQRLRQRLPAHMVPAVFVQLDRLPLMPSGKIDRRALRDISAGPTAERRRDPTSPRSQAESLIAKIWQEVLRLEGVGLQANFFEHGGHSLLLLRVQDRIREETGLEIPVTDLFNYPTVETLAQRLSHQQEASRQRAEEQAGSRRRGLARQEALSMKARIKAEVKAYGKQLKAQLKEEAKAAFGENKSSAEDDAPEDSGASNIA